MWNSLTAPLFDAPGLVPGFACELPPAGVQVAPVDTAGEGKK